MSQRGGRGVQQYQQGGRGGQQYQQGSRAPNDSSAINQRAIIVPVDSRSQLMMFSSSAHEKGFNNASDVRDAHRALERIHFTQSVSQQVLGFRRQGHADEQRFETAKVALESARRVEPRKVAGWATLPLTLLETVLQAPDGLRALGDREATGETAEKVAVARSPRGRVASSPRSSRPGTPQRRSGSPQSPCIAVQTPPPSPSAALAGNSRKRQRAGCALSSIADSYKDPV